MASITRWRPFHELSLGNRDLGDLWRRFFDEENGALAQWSPAADVVETPEQYVVKIEVPGFDEDDVRVTLTGENLTIRGERKEEERREEDNWHVTERRSGSFLRSFTLPGAVDQESVEAKLEDGVLSVHLHKNAKAQATRIDVKKKS